MKYLTLPIIGLSTALALQPALAQEMPAKPAGDAVPVMSVDRDTFLAVFASANEFEIRSSRLAGENAPAAGVKEAAGMIVADHEKAGSRLKAILEAKGAPPPPAAGLAPRHRRMMEQLEAAEGGDFDALYLDMQAQAHMEAIALFRTFAGSGDDAELVGFAKETLPSLENHLAHVMKLSAM